METFDQYLPPMDPTKAKLRYKLSYYGLTEGVTEYEEECVDMIAENLYVYMKSVLRQMANYKRTYKIVCPLLMEEEESEEKTDESKKKLFPWETPFDYRKVSPEFLKKIKENDLKDDKEIDLMRSQLLHTDLKSKPSWMTDIDYVASLNIDGSKDFKKNNKNKKESIDDSSYLKNLGMCSEKYDSSKMHEVVKVCIKCGEKFEVKFCDQCKKPTESSVKENLKVGKESETKKQSKKISDLKAECQMLEDCLKIPIKYEPFSEAIYPSKVFDIKDMMQLFKSNPLIIPQRSIYQITMMRIANSQPSESPDFNFQSKCVKGDSISPYPAHATHGLRFQ